LIAAEINYKTNPTSGLKKIAGIYLSVEGDCKWQRKK
jgi:hypothetical protein